MKTVLIMAILSTQVFAFFNTLTTFEADFTQSITDEKDKILTYSGTIVASKPQNALWRYEKPVSKDVYINAQNVTVIEPEIEQAIIRKIESNFDFFKMIKSAKAVNKNTFLAKYGKSEFLIRTDKNLIDSISYIDEFENQVRIVFVNQKQNLKINKDIFTPRIPVDFDIIRD